jgi:hypothetical protein
VHPVSIERKIAIVVMPIRFRISPPFPIGYCKSDINREIAIFKNSAAIDRSGRESRFYFKKSVF